MPSYPTYRGQTTAEVVVIGGGLTGCATAYALGASGIAAVVLEAARIGRGASGSSSGWLSDDPGVGFADLQEAIGRRAARRAWSAWHRAGLDFAALLRRLGVQCRIEPRETVTIAVTPEQARRLERERRARRDAGFEAPWLRARAATRAAALPAAAAIRTREGATVDPYRAAIGLAAAASARGVRIFERSLVRRVTFTRKTADVHLAGGSIRTSRVIVATGAPTALYPSLRRHFRFRQTYLAMTAPIPAKIRRSIAPAGLVVRDQAAPPHVVRWVGEDRLLVCGADGEMVPDRSREKVIVQRTGQLMYELSTLYPDISGIPPAYGWDAPYARTADGLPYIGPHRNYPHHLFAFGDAGHSMTGAYLASRILLRHHRGARHQADEAFGFRWSD